VSYMAFNPAGLTRHPGDHGIFTVIAIAPSAEFKKDRSTTVLGGTIGGGNGGSDVAPDALAPALYLSHQFSPRLFGGVSLTVPFGLSTDYDSGWAGRYHALKTELTTYDLNPVVAYKVTPALSLGGGVRIAYTRGVLSNAVDFGTLDALPVGSGGFGGANGGTPTQDDGIATIEGDDLALGYNLGVLYDIAPGTRIGAAYRSELRNRLDGAADFNNSAVGNAIAASSNAFVRTGARANLNLPETVSFGAYHEVDPRLTVMAEVAWTHWNRMRELRVQFDNSHQSDSVITENWRNTWFFAVGATYQMNDHWKLRGGLAYDQSPVPDATRTPRIPDEDRKWVSVGASYQFSPDATADIGYTHLFINNPSIQLSTSDTNNALRGNLNGSFDAAADILALQVRVRF